MFKGDGPLENTLIISFIPSLKGCCHFAFFNRLFIYDLGSGRGFYVNNKLGEGKTDKK